MADWFTCGNASGIGNGQIGVTVEPNTDQDPRTGQIIVTSGEGIQRVVNIRQLGNDDIIIVPEFDYLVLSYAWTDADGSDYDSATTFTNTGASVNGQSIDYRYVGWSRQMANSTNRIGDYLRWGGDNQGSGQETVLIGMTDLVADFPNAPEEIIIDIRGNWYERVGNGNVTISFNAYLGGTMVLNNYVFSNEGGTTVLNQSVNANVNTSGNNNWQNFGQLYKLVAKFIYNKTTKDGMVVLQ